MNDKSKFIWSDIIGYLAVAVVALIYIGTALFVPGVKDKSLGTIIAEGATGFALGVAINFNLNLQGILKGKRSDQLQATRQTHAEAVERITPHIHRLDGWCAQQNALALHRERSRILTAAGMRYDDYFDATGAARDVSFEEMPEEVAAVRKKAWHAALNVRITPLSTASLTGDGERPDDPFNFGETPEQYQRRTNIADMISKIVMAVIFGYFGVDMVENFQFAELAWRALYVAILFALGISKLLQSYLFMVDTYRGGIVQKINHLQSFENWAAKHPPESEEKHGNDEHPGAVQERAAEAVGGAAEKGEGAGPHQSAEAA